MSGVIHVGANTGQEREHYASLDLNVLWIEPIPAVFEQLRSNISGFPKQRACRYLVAAQDGVPYRLNLSNNGGASSSILEFARHRELWPEVEFTSHIDVTGITLAHVIEQEAVDLDAYGALVLDTQGSELLVLKGAVPVLDRFRFIKAEVADFESYSGGCRLSELSAFMREHGFDLFRKAQFAGRSAVGKYYDVLYRRR